MNPPEDAALMSQVREGHLEMLAVLFERHHVRLFQFFLRLTRSRERSEDLVQEVFLRILKYRETFRAPSPFAPWMYQIARRVHVSHLRKQRGDLPVDELMDEVPDPGESAALLLERRQDQDLLREALERLPLRKRELLLLSRHEELGYKDLAVMFECSLGALKVEVHRAVKDLRKVFLKLQGGAL